MNDIQQRTDEWFEERRGKITASRFQDVIAIGRNGKPLKARDDYMLELVHERTSGLPKQEINSRSLSWGREAEEYAVGAYELDSGFLVQAASFITHPMYDFIGGSPDGLVGKDGLIEVKSPHDEKVHLRTWLHGMPEEHTPQVQGNLMCTGRKWLDFISYDPRAAENLRIYVQRIWRDDAYINDFLLPSLVQFNIEVESLVKQIMEKSA